MGNTSREIASLAPQEVESSGAVSAITEPVARRASPRSDATDQEKFIAEITRDVKHATHGGVRDLWIEMSGDGVELRGRCSTYYCKQLAQHAAMRAAVGAPVTNQIEVW